MKKGFQPAITMEEFKQRTQVLILTLTNAKVEAGRLGLFETMHSIEEPVTKIGWEVAKVLEGKHHVRPIKPGFWEPLDEKGA
ncbi:hypothetical protein LCGC14_1692500 [marine sediment metagenome]|uniref:Uncharacterized protein n=1 Tax=marine sediment metagenome TaxID=412755 RepID=A0A0F9K0W5_9ZZZZ